MYQRNSTMAHRRIINQGAEQARENVRRGYADKYEDDPLYEELGNEARIWRVMLDEGRIVDAAMLQRFRDHLDVDLVFAGLFSAVLTTFVVQTSQTPSTTGDTTIALLLEIIAIQRAWANDPRVDGVASFSPPPPAPSPSPWINRCWFLSLIFSLLAAFGAVVVRQWLQEYESDIAGPPKRRALVRHFRRVGLENYKVHVIVPILPMLLHVSLLLFFIGLILYVGQSDPTMSRGIIALTVMIYLLYVLTNVLPVFYPQCPYRSPLSTAGYWAKSLYMLLHARLPLERRPRETFAMPPGGAPKDLPTSDLEDDEGETSADDDSGYEEGHSVSLRRGVIWAKSRGRQLHDFICAIIRTVGTAWKRYGLDALKIPSDHEWDTVLQKSDDLIPDSLDWAMQASPDLSIAPLVVQASAGLRYEGRNWRSSTQPHTRLLHNRIIPWFYNALSTRRAVFDWAPGRDNELLRMAHSLLLVQDSLGKAQFHLCTSRVFQALTLALLDLPNTPAVTATDMAQMSATLLALQQRLDWLTPFWVRNDTGAVLETIAQAYSLLKDTPLVTDMGCLKITSSRDSVDDASRLHMTCHAIDSYSKEDSADGNAAFDDNLGFLAARLTDLLLTTLGHDSIDSALRTIGHSAVSAAFKSTFLVHPPPSFAGSGLTNTPLPVTFAMSLFWFLLKLAREPEHTVDKVAILNALSRHASNYCEFLAEALDNDEISVELLLEVVSTVLHDHQLACLDITDALALSLATQLSKVAARANSEQVDKKFPAASYKLHSALLSLKPTYRDMWKQQLDEHLRPRVIPLVVALALKTTHGCEALAEWVDDLPSLVQDPSSNLDISVPDEAKNDEDLNWYRHFTSDPGKYINARPRRWWLHISELVSFDEAVERMQKKDAKHAWEDERRLRGNGAEADTSDDAESPGPVHGGLEDRGGAEHTQSQIISRLRDLGAWGVAPFKRVRPFLASVRRPRLGSSFIKLDDIDVERTAGASILPGPMRSESNPETKETEQNPGIEAQGLALQGQPRGKRFVTAASGKLDEQEVVCDPEQARHAHERCGEKGQEKGSGSACMPTRESVNADGGKMRRAAGTMWWEARTKSRGKGKEPGWAVWEAAVGLARRGIGREAGGTGGREGKEMGGRDGCRRSHRRGSRAEDMVNVRSARRGASSVEDFDQPSPSAEATPSDNKGLLRGFGVTSRMPRSRSQYACPRRLPLLFDSRNMLPAVSGDVDKWSWKSITLAGTVYRKKSSGIVQPTCNVLNAMTDAARAVVPIPRALNCDLTSAIAEINVIGVCLGTVWKSRSPHTIVALMIAGQKASTLG
ncbi:uncharacterized protein SCHCODRAFT_0238437 [Schizophyllum commune H4-8]|uniref:DUF6535 domain-containing protein n=1 Tax=Schizophyllum commune (strain H4-8 / FGSC 9210) TaxID=578458 RepID=D8QK49_SCHCM|nr:uncharacterized protein SCHCODRAFT_0238437 [Schizophyllum commune H4-8]KAI5885710.1 hypothetical protein SCHCODRAFT_0238437 [Schizophyllum commune H4-8]